MTKDVLVSISGLQYDIDGDEPVEIVTVGNYYYQHNKHYIIYEEVIKDIEGITKNTIKINDKKVDILKKGMTNVHMEFEQGKKNMTYYNTPYGDLLISVNTTKIKLIELENYITVRINYGLEVNYAFVSECTIDISVKALQNKGSDSL